MTDSPSEAPAPVQDQPTEAPEVDATGADTSQAEAPDYFGDNFDPNTLDDPRLQQAYKQMHGAFTQKTQTLAEQRKQVETQQALLEALQGDDEDARQQALTELGFEFDDPDTFEEIDDEPIEYDDPIDEIRAELEAFKAEREAEKTQAEQAQELARLTSGVEEQFTQLADKHQREIPEPERELAAMVAVTSPPGKNGLPDVMAAHDKLEAYVQERFNAYVASKQAPAPPQQGQPGTEAQDLSTHEARVAHIARRLQADTANP